MTNTGLTQDTITSYGVNVYISEHTGQWMWISHSDGVCRAHLTDGYVEYPLSLRSALADRDHGLELYTAEQLYVRLRSERQRRGVACKSLHVWVIGEDGWTRRYNRQQHQAWIADDDSPNYRVIVYAEDRDQNSRPIITSVADYVRAAGMTRKKRSRAHLQAFQFGAGQLLKQLVRYYAEYGEAPHNVFNDYMLPVSFVGHGPISTDPSKIVLSPHESNNTESDP